MKLLSTNACMWNARRAGTAIPAFNIPFLPMIEAVVEALRATDCFGLIAVARLEWVKFEAESIRGQRLQLKADIFGVPFVRPRVTEASVLGAAILAGMATRTLGKVRLLVASRTSSSQNKCCQEFCPRVLRCAEWRARPTIRGGLRAESPMLRRRHAERRALRDKGAA